MDVRGVPPGSCVRRAVGKQRSEGPVSAAVDFGMAALDVRFRLVAAVQSLHFGDGGHEQ